MGKITLLLPNIVVSEMIKHQIMNSYALELLDIDMIKLKRIYEPVDPEDGFRVLVERLWPRGISKAKASLDLWLKEIAPSTQLRMWFSHDPAKWNVFQKLYFEELQSNAAVTDLIHRCKAQNVTFIYAASDTEHNAAIALKEYIERCLENVH